MQKYKSKGKGGLRKRCYVFGLNVIELVDSFPNKRASWIIADQLIRSGTSIGANLVEATASSSRREYKKFFEIALKSANETKYWLSLARDAKIADKSQIKVLLKETDELARMIAAGVIKLKSNSNL